MSDDNAIEVTVKLTKRELKLMEYLFTFLQPSCKSLQEKLEKAIEDAKNGHQ